MIKAPLSLETIGGGRFQERPAMTLHELSNVLVGAPKAQVGLNEPRAALMDQGT